MPQVLLPFPNSRDSLASQMIHTLAYPILVCVVTATFHIPELLFISEQGLATIRPLKGYTRWKTQDEATWDRPPRYAPGHGSGRT